MKKNLGYVGLTVLGFALIALAADVTTDYDHSANFGKYHTCTPGMSASASNSLWSDRIKNAVDSQLTAKGWQQVPSGGDATVAAIGKTSNQQTLQTFYDGFPGWRWGGFGRVHDERRKSESRHSDRRHLRHANQEADLARTRRKCAFR